MDEFLCILGFRGDFLRPPKWMGTIIGVLLFTIIIAFVLSFFLVVLIFFVALFGPVDDQLKDRAENIRNIGLVIAAFVGVPFLIWRTSVASEQAKISSAALFNEKITDASKGLSARKQVSHISTDISESSVFNAWEDDIVVRSMAIHRLESLANERRQFSPRIARMLASYVRGNFRAENLNPSEDIQFRVTPRMDLQDAIDALGRILKVAQNEDVENWRINLRGTNLDGVNFNRGFFRAADLRQSRLEGALLSFGNFEGALFCNSLFNYADFMKSNLTGANLSDIIYNLPKVGNGGFYAGIGHADITGVDLSDADLSAITFLGGAKKMSQTFGNIDTTLNSRLRPARPSQDELDTAYLFRSGTVEQPHSKDQLEIFGRVDGSGFQNWSPYTSNDMANSSIKEKLMIELGLNKWPYVGL